MTAPENGSIANRSDVMLKFLLKQPGSTALAARLGELVTYGRPALPTPHYVATTSRGAVPHVSPDMLAKYTGIKALYYGIEDFVEKSGAKAPIYHTPQKPSSSILRDYTGISDQCWTILGPRRVPSIPCPGHNTNSSIAISTSVGFRYLENENYTQAVAKLRADIATSLVDLTTGETVSRKRIERSADRTHAWLRDILNPGDGIQSPLFASILPLEPEQQSHYLADLGDEFKEQIAGICTFEPSTSGAIPKGLCQLPRICLKDPSSPHEVLHAVSLGVDMITTPFVTRASEQGVVLDFDFPAREEASNISFGFDIWSEEYATEVLPLKPGCKCYTCTKHHRAYVHHLLQAKEMLAWTLLQIHNYHVFDQFFQQIRETIRRGSFEAGIKTFNHVYETEMPKKSGEGPRIRGYQMKSRGHGEPRKNAKVYGRLDEQAFKLAEAESGIATPQVDSDQLENQGFADKM